MYIYLFLINHLVNYEIFYPRILFLRTFNSGRSYNEVWWFTNANSKPLEIEDKINITVVIT